MSRRLIQNLENFKSPISQANKLENAFRALEMKYFHSPHVTHDIFSLPVKDVKLIYADLDFAAFPHISLIISKSLGRSQSCHFITKEGCLIEFFTGKASLLFCFCRKCSKFYLCLEEDLNCPECRAKNAVSIISKGFIPHFKKLLNINDKKSNIEYKHSLLSLFQLEENFTGQLFDNTLLPHNPLEEESLKETLLRRLRGTPFENQWPEANHLIELEERHPNKKNVMDLVFEEYRLSEFRKSKGFKLPHLLLVGPPSCGKSSFAKELARILSPHNWGYCDMAQASPHFALVGLDSGFKHAKPGIILEQFLGSEKFLPCKNPVLILDELEKSISTDHEFSPLPALLNITDKGTASGFRDEFLKVSIDASGLVIIGLANSIKGIL